VNLQLLHGTTRAHFGLVFLTILATAASASEPGWPTDLPDAPSALLAERVQTLAADTSMAQNMSFDGSPSAGSTSQENARPNGGTNVEREIRHAGGFEPATSQRVRPYFRRGTHIWEGASC
jgi:hypothetical protein